MNLFKVKKEAVIYISGGITGIDDAEERFENAAKQLRLLSFRKIINPQKLCEVYQYEADYENYIDVCMTMINHVNVIYMLKGWEKSPGACRERDKAMTKGLTVVYE